MKHSGKAFLFMMSLLLAGCKAAQGTGDSDAASGIPGRWVAEELLVYKNLGTSQEEKQIIGIISGKKPTETIFEPQGTFQELYFANGDSLLKTRTGFWHQYQDSLYLTYADEGAKRSGFGIEQSGRRLRLRLRVDFDGDGDKDDLMEVVMKKD